MPSRPTHSPWTRLLAGWAAAVAVCAAAAWPTHEQTVNYSGSLQCATGSYLFAERTHSVYLFNGLDLSHGRLQAAVSLPVIYQSSPWVLYTVVGSVPSGGPQQGAVGGRGSGNGSGDGGGPGSGRRRGGDPIVLPDTATYADIGVGDPSLRADLTLLRDTTGPIMRLAGSAKAPVADVDRGFGTGAGRRPQPLPCATARSLVPLWRSLALVARRHGRPDAPKRRQLQRVPRPHLSKRSPRRASPASPDTPKSLMRPPLRCKQPSG